MEKLQHEFKPRIHILAYGGTIASRAMSGSGEFYDSPTVDILDLLLQIKSINKIADVTCEQVSQVISHDMTIADLYNLARKVESIVNQTDIDGVVITQGTNTIEETSYFLSLLINTKKPIVFTGSMFPMDALGYDGLRNLYNSILVASSMKESKLGVVLSFNDIITSARDTVKQNPSAINGLSLSPESILGYIQGDKVNINKIPVYKHTYTSEFQIGKIQALPKVYLVYGHLDCDGLFVEAAIANGATGIISVGMGRGYQSKETTNALIEAAKNGLIVVRSSRTGNGFVSRDVKLDDKYGFIAGGSLNPVKARILLAIALCNTSDKSKIQQYFYEY